MKGSKASAMGIKVAAMTATLGLIGLTVSSQASAGCSFNMLPGKTSAAHLAPTVYRPDEQGAFIRASDIEDWGPSIVGLWQVEFISEGNSTPPPNGPGIPDGAVVDFGTALWNSDGTETMVSGGRDPSDGDVCMGAWVQTGSASFRLNHVALAWAGGAYLGLASIVENVTVTSKGSFHGSFTITQYAYTGKSYPANPMEPGQEFDKSKVAAVVTGAIKGTRVTAY